MTVKICTFARGILDIIKELKDNHSVAQQGKAQDHSHFSQSREERLSQKGKKAARTSPCQITELVSKALNDKALSVEMRCYLFKCQNHWIALQKLVRSQNGFLSQNRN